ncbi:hypothetical protein MJO28_016181 [Puccinia striiformis f. sp. tritici]|uniref:Uncharacterized protein n=1 Tax=Puccinia striiformis f. sp. tritici TaxID=168172 RepID=A0ACC0DP41_9BASI|nr:hypothetical protein MJO28_016181 [Puccinia striiformis f. sp. tritici]
MSSALMNQAHKITRRFINYSRLPSRPANCSHRLPQNNQFKLIENEYKAYSSTKFQSTRSSSLPGKWPSSEMSKTKKTSAGVLLAMAGYQITRPTIQLDSELSPQTMDYHLSQPPQQTSDEPEQLEEEYTSLLSVQKLSFGTLTGICAGVFVRKGLSFLAFLCGGGFVLLQYLHSSSLINVDWRTWASRYESRFWSTKEPRSTTTPSKSIVARFLDFLTADFQYRSTFTVGFFLGLRIG